MAHWRPIAGSLSCVFGQDTFSVRLSTQEYRWVPAKCTNNVQVPIFADSSLLFFFLFFKYFVVPQHSYFRIKVSEWWRNVDYCFICFEMLDSHDVQREQFSTSVPRGFTLLYHVVGQVRLTGKTDLRLPIMRRSFQSLFPPLPRHLNF